MSAPDRGFYHSLEAGRFIAAFLVMMFHVTPVAQKVYGDYPFADVFRAGHFGVEYFFVLSGFLMHAIHAGQLGQAGAGLEFARRRAVRILPAYWIVLFGLILGLFIAPGLGASYDLSFGKIVSDMFLVSWNEKMILGVAWTLKRELIFYALFALCLAVPRFGLWPIWGWQLAILFANLLMPEIASGAGRGHELLSTVNLGFGAGMLISMALRRSVLTGLSSGWLWRAVGSAALGLLICSYLEWLWHAGSSHDVTPLGPLTSPLIYTALAMLMIAGLVGLERKGRLNIAWLPSIFGRSSYALYLIHAPFLSVSMRIMREIGIVENLALVTAICCAGAVVAAMAFCVLVEQPLVKALNRATAPIVRKRVRGELALAPSDSRS